MRNLLMMICLLLSCVLFAPVDGARGQSAPHSDLPRQALVFAHHRDGDRNDYDIWQIAADGTQLASVLVRPKNQANFSISPDGNELVFADNSTGNYELYRRKFSGGEVENLTNSEHNELSPSWSPDGLKLLFTSNRDGDDNELYIMKLEDKSVTQVTDNDVYDGDSTWSADGEHLVFTRFFPGDEENNTSGRGVVIRRHLDSGDEKELTDNQTGYAGGSDCSPDGKRIAYHLSSEDGVELWVMDFDGGNPTRLTETFIDEYSPTWSPDGSWIAYTAGTGSDGQGTFDLWLIRPDGSDAHVICRAANTQMSPQWRRGERKLR